MGGVGEIDLWVGCRTGQYGDSLPTTPEKTSQGSMPHFFGQLGKPSKKKDKLGLLGKPRLEPPPQRKTYA